MAASSTSSCCRPAASGAAERRRGRADATVARVRTLEDIERAVRELSAEDLRAFREWFAELDAELWDRQIERDAAEGRLNGLIEEALRTPS